MRRYPDIRIVFTLPDNTVFEVPKEKITPDILLQLGVFKPEEFKVSYDNITLTFEDRDLNLYKTIQSGSYVDVYMTINGTETLIYSGIVLPQNSVGDVEWKDYSVSFSIKNKLATILDKTFQDAFPTQFALFKDKIMVMTASDLIGLFSSFSYPAYVPMSSLSTAVPNITDAVDKTFSIDNVVKPPVIAKDVGSQVEVYTGSKDGIHVSVYYTDSYQHKYSYLQMSSSTTSYIAFHNNESGLYGVVKDGSNVYLYNDGNIVALNDVLTLHAANFSSSVKYRMTTDTANAYIQEYDVSTDTWNTIYTTGDQYQDVAVGVYADSTSGTYIALFYEVGFGYGLVVENTGGTVNVYPISGGPTSGLGSKTQYHLPLALTSPGDIIFALGTTIVVFHYVNNTKVGQYTANNDYFVSYGGGLHTYEVIDGVPQVVKYSYASKAGLTRNVLTLDKDVTEYYLSSSYVSSLLEITGFQTANSCAGLFFTDKQGFLFSASFDAINPSVAFPVEDGNTPTVREILDGLATGFIGMWRQTGPDSVEIISYEINPTTTSGTIQDTTIPSVYRMVYVTGYEIQTRIVPVKVGTDEVILRLTGIYEPYTAYYAMAKYLRDVVPASIIDLVVSGYLDMNIGDAVRIQNQFFDVNGTIIYKEYQYPTHTRIKVITGGI